MNGLIVDEVAPHEIKRLCYLTNTILIDIISVKTSKLRIERCLGVK